MLRPPCWARRTRKASLKRASVKAAPIPTTHQYLVGSRRSSRARSGLARVPPRGRDGSRTPNTSSPTARAPGTTATLKTARTSSSQSSISPTASSGPIKAPTVSSDCRSPNAAPRTSGGAMPATWASRGAPRMPLPTRSIIRAPRTKAGLVARAKSGFDWAPSPYPRTASGLRWPSQSLKGPETTLTISAVASARPSMAPMVRALAPSTLDMKAGSRLWMSSDDVSISRLTSPSATIPNGILDPGGLASVTWWPCGTARRWWPPRSRR
jgi:hypothetical protein